jgi:hypothetical protein
MAEKRADALLELGHVEGQRVRKGVLRARVAGPRGIRQGPPAETVSSMTACDGAAA